MKKSYLILLLCALCIGNMRAEKVGADKARTVATAFYNIYSSTKATASDAQLVHTFGDTRQGEGVYVFNINSGFVMVSSDDIHRPIVGYSYEGTFDANNISPELSYYIDKMIEGRNYLPKQRRSDASSEWDALLSGRSISRGERVQFFLCETLWDQDYPYNYYAPIDNGHRTYAGCVACAMSQIMKFWDSPVRGTGAHQYNYGSFGILSANFDTTYYDWSNMPNYITSYSSWEQIDAISTLMYHCGVSVEMMFGTGGSGAYSEDVPEAIINHFSFTEDANLRYRDNYSLAEWQNMLKAEFDQGWPVYYSGSEPSGGHAFVCDGYDDNNLFHFNWGWSGSGNGFFAIDELNVSGYHFNMGQGAIFNMVPRDVYENTPNPPDNFTAVTSGNSDFNATISWTNPVSLRDGQALPAIDRLVLLRNGNIVYEAENVAIGAEMSFTDHVGLPIKVYYEIYVVYDNRVSNRPKTRPVVIGPMCEWKITMMSNNSTGWNGGSIIVRNSAFDTLSTNTLESSAEITLIDVPVGNMTFAWKKPKNDTHNEDHVGFNIRNSQNQIVYSYNGALGDIPEGTFLSINNNCEGGLPCQQPITLNIESDDNDINLSWESSDAEYGYIIYRDGILYDFVSGTSYTDHEALSENHNYAVTGFCSGGESEHSNIVFESEDNCEAPHNFRYTTLSDGKIQFEWDKPENTQGLRGFIIYKRAIGTKYQIQKMCSSNTTSYKMSPTILAGNVYQFCITASYTGDCESSPAIVAGDSGLNYLELNNTILPLNLHIVSADDVMKIAWDESLVAESYNVYRNGQLIAENHPIASYTDATVEAGNTYCYTVTGNYGAFESGQSNEVCAEFIITSIDEAQKGISITPNPTKGALLINSTQQILNVEISNVAGQKVANLPECHNNATIDLSQYGKGVYIIKIETDTESLVRKVVVM